MPSYDTTTFIDSDAAKYHRFLDEKRGGGEIIEAEFLKEVSLQYVAPKIYWAKMMNITMLREEKRRRLTGLTQLCT